MTLSPCVKICKLVDGICIECFRTINEIASWRSLLTNEKEIVINALLERNLTMQQNVELAKLREAQKTACEEVGYVFEEVYRRGRPSQDVIDKKKSLEKRIKELLNENEVPVKQIKEKTEITKTVRVVQPKPVKRISEGTEKPLHNCVIEGNIFKDPTDEEMNKICPEGLRLKRVK